MHRTQAFLPPPVQPDVGAIPALRANPSLRHCLCRRTRSGEKAQ